MLGGNFSSQAFLLIHHYFFNVSASRFGPSKKSPSSSDLGHCAAAVVAWVQDAKVANTET